MPSLFTLRFFITRYRYHILALLFFTLTEIWFHSRSYNVRRPSEPLDPAFALGCRNPPDALFAHDPHSPPHSALLPRENATVLMLARNDEVDEAVNAIKSFESQFNRWYNYPVVFLNDKPWSREFKEKVGKEVSGKAIFSTIPTEMWNWPKDKEGNELIDQKKYAKLMKEMAKHDLPYVENVNYHHMCRFYSGFFYDHPALQPYKYYWRLEPSITYTCAIPYDPFRSLRLTNKTYGYTLALWEIGRTAPSLFRTTHNHKSAHSIPTTSLWTSLLDASWAPLPLRWSLMSNPSLFHSRTPGGDAWNMCHMWSNFEIADLDFFRSEQYRRFFRELDATGNFYYERWGDAAVHSLAAGLFLEPWQVHWFEDIGYAHPPFQHCPKEGVGCNCRCLEGVGVVDGFCTRRLREGVDPY
ncbi:MAG: hypothetical protein M1820_009427 [Bogoriella megaspora]|nr:MAG: hypothetical protein M1820_009427 [Bogoriella megaspora]